jgi:transposase-like protein
MSDIYSERHIRPMPRRHKTMVTKRMWMKVFEELDKGGSLKACARKHNVAPKNVRRWRSRREAVLQVADTMCDVTTRHSFLSRQTMHKGRAPWTEKYTLQKILTMYQEMRDKDLIVTLNLLAAELKRLDRSVQGLSLTAILCRIWRHIKKHGVVWRCVTHVAQNTRYEQSVI